MEPLKQTAAGPPIQMAAVPPSSVAPPSASSEIVERCGRPSWRVATVHYHNVAAKRGAEAVKYALANFLRLMIRDRVDIVGGDFNQAHKYVREVCEALGAPFQILEGRGPEVSAVMFFHKGFEPYHVEARHNLADQEEFGIKERDTSTHYPLAMLMHPSSVYPDQYSTRGARKLRWPGKGSTDRRPN